MSVPNLKQFCSFSVVRCLVRRYITDVQRKSQDTDITEDDINEVWYIYHKSRSLRTKKIQKYSRHSYNTNTDHATTNGSVTAMALFFIFYDQERFNCQSLWQGL